MHVVPLDTKLNYICISSLTVPTVSHVRSIDIVLYLFLMVIASGESRIGRKQQPKSEQKMSVYK